MRQLSAWLWRLPVYGRRSLLFVTTVVVVSFIGLKLSGGLFLGPAEDALPASTRAGRPRSCASEDQRIEGGLDGAGPPALLRVGARAACPHGSVPSLRCLLFLRSFVRIPKSFRTIL